jgi:hypothetical protein
MKKKFLVFAGIAAATALAGGWAFAQASGPSGFGPPFIRGMGPETMGPAMMQRMHPGAGPGMMFGGPGLTVADPAHIERLKTELGITAAQESAWAKYAKTLQDAATAMRTAREGINPDTVSKLSPQERFAFMTKIREQGQKQFEAVKTAANELLATLDETQKGKAQEILPGLAFGPGAMHHAGVSGPPFRP